MKLDGIMGAASVFPSTTAKDCQEPGEAEQGVREYP